jgi:hypothetical protein
MGPFGRGVGDGDATSLVLYPFFNFCHYPVRFLMTTGLLKPAGRFGKIAPSNENEKSARGADQRHPTERPVVDPGVLRCWRSLVEDGIAAKERKERKNHLKKNPEYKFRAGVRKSHGGS